MLGLRYWPSILKMLMLWLVYWLPWHIRSRIADGAAAVYARLPTRRKAFAMANLQVCYPESSTAQRLAFFRENSRVLCHVYLHLGVIAFGPPALTNDRFNVRDLAGIDAILESQRSVILLSVHALGVEYANIFLSSVHPLVVLARPNRNTFLDWAETRMRRRTGNLLYSVRAPLIGAIKAARRGRWLAYAPDIDAGHIYHAFAPFFNIPKATAPTLARLAASCDDALVIPIGVEYTPSTGRFELTFHPPLGSDLSPTAMNQSLELIIRTNPRQFAWSVKLFKTRPAGFPAIYGKHPERISRAGLHGAIGTPVEKTHTTDSPFWSRLFS
jgi:lauroyl-KDO2-lipid IV(A) myristoyltransferase